MSCRDVKFYVSRHLENNEPLKTNLGFYYVPTLVLNPRDKSLTTNYSGFVGTTTAGALEFVDGFAGTTTGLIGFFTGFNFTLFFGDELSLRVSLNFLSLSTKDGEGTTFLGGVTLVLGLVVVLRRLCDAPEELLLLFGDLRFLD